MTTVVPVIPELDDAELPDSDAEEPFYCNDPLDAADAHYVYMLGSNMRNHRSKVYMGYSENPHRRLRKHNGLLPGGAKYTKHYSPGNWYLAMVIAGFTDKREALRFEYDLQNPGASRIRDYSTHMNVGMPKPRRTLKNRLVLCAFLMEVYNKAGKDLWVAYEQDGN